MAGYDDTRQIIIEALTGRPAGTQIQPEKHQESELALLEYTRQVELISSGGLQGVAKADTVPVQPNNSKVSYIASLSMGQSITFSHFYNQSGGNISITAPEDTGYIIILSWNTSYWSYDLIETSVQSVSDAAFFKYILTIRKTYDSVESMNEDVSAPIGNDGREILNGELVSVINESDSNENAIYSYNSSVPKWIKQTSFSVTFNDRVFDGGRADSVYGGARTINCGGANS